MICQKCFLLCFEKKQVCPVGRAQIKPTKFLAQWQDYSPRGDFTQMVDTGVKLVNVYLFGSSVNWTSVYLFDSCKN